MWQKEATNLTTHDANRWRGELPALNMGMLLAVARELGMIGHRHQLGYCV